MDYADLSLFTAARLSAAFTYVSPATRIPDQFVPRSNDGRRPAFHVVDGGYFDNDGVSSAIEFLTSAVAPCVTAQELTDELESPKLDVQIQKRIAFMVQWGVAALTRSPSGKFTPSFSTEEQKLIDLCKDFKRLPILLIEIRDSYDIDAHESPDSYARQAYQELIGSHYRPLANVPGPLGPLGELLAPPEAALNAGFSSSTLRNRRELDLLRRAVADKLEIHPIVLDYRMFHCNESSGRDHTCLQSAAGPSGSKRSEEDEEKNVALSWHLTERQQSAILGLQGLEVRDGERVPCWKVQPALLRYDGIKESPDERIRSGLAWLQLVSGRIFPNSPVEVEATCRNAN